MSEKFICYFRVSTADQGRSGLGLGAQRKTVMDYLNDKGAESVGEYTEIESGGKNDRPELHKALKACRLKKAKLIVSKLDRLSRDLHFITELQQSKARFVIAEMPDANNFTLQIYGALAENERKDTSRRTKAALAELKANPEKLKEKGLERLGNPYLGKGKTPTAKMIANPAGDTTNANLARTAKADDFAADVLSAIEEARECNCLSLREIADFLNTNNFEAKKGGEWHAASVARIIKRMQAKP